MLPIKVRWLVLIVIIIGLGLAAFVSTARYPQKIEPPPSSDSAAIESRAQFFNKIVKIEVGVSIDQVSKTLGNPDQIWTRDQNKIFNPHVKMVWCYGTHENLGFPTLGRVEFDNAGFVFQVIGNTGEPFIHEYPEEPRLRELLARIDRLHIDGGKFDPFEFIDLINVFRRMGQKKSHAVFREYVRVAGVRGKDVEVIVLLYCLHNAQKKISLNHPMLAKSEPPDQPKFPIQFVNDIPLMISQGYSGTGPTPSVEKRLKMFEEAGDWIDNCLIVTDESPKQVLESFRKFRLSKIWRFEEHRSEQIWKMLETQVRRFLISREKARENS